MNVLENLHNVTNATKPKTVTTVVATVAATYTKLAKTSYLCTATVVENI